MPDLEWNKITLAKYSSNQEILALLIAQLIKDFESCGVSLVLFPDSTANHIIETVFNALYKDIRSSNSKIHQLLYRIDVSESTIGQITDQNDYTHFVRSLTEVIINRELKKVLIRKNYSPS
jgi:hypothetical protein